MKILIVKLSSLGDVIQTLPILQPLKKRYPKANVTWLVEKEAAELLIDHPLIDNVLISQKNRWLKEWVSYRKWPQLFRELFDFIKKLRADTYDLIIDFQGLLKSGILVGICRGKQKLGFYPGREKSHIFLNEKILYPDPPIHAVQRYLYLLESLGCSCPYLEFFIPIRQVHRDKVMNFFHDKKITPDDPIVLLHPGTRWKTKLWEEEKWATLGDWLQKKNGAQVIFTGSKEDFPLIQRICGTMKLPGINTAGEWGLKELAFLQRQAKVIITPDSGPMHLAAAMATPVIALFGPTEPALTGPFGNIHRIIIKPVECRPCFKRKCSFNKCMRAILADEVWEVTKPYLACSITPKVVTQ